MTFQSQCTEASRIRRYQIDQWQCGGRGRCGSGEQLNGVILTVVRWCWHTCTLFPIIEWLASAPIQNVTIGLCVGENGKWNVSQTKVQWLCVWVLANIVRIMMTDDGVVWHHIFDLSNTFSLTLALLKSKIKHIPHSIGFWLPRPHTRFYFSNKNGNKTKSKRRNDLPLCDTATPDYHTLFTQLSIKLKLNRPKWINFFVVAVDVKLSMSSTHCTARIVLQLRLTFICSTSCVCSVSVDVVFYLFIDESMDTIRNFVCDIAVCVSVGSSTIYFPIWFCFGDPDNVSRYAHSYTNNNGINNNDTLSPMRWWIDDTPRLCPIGRV